MRVLFVINGFSYGGAEKLAFDLAQGLSSICEYVGVAALYRMGNDTEERIQQNLKKSVVKHLFRVLLLLRKTLLRKILKQLKCS